MSSNTRTETQETRTNSPSAVNSLVFNDSKVLAFAALILSCCAFGGVIAATILIPEIIEARADQAGAGAREAARIAEREARVAIDRTDALRMELAKKGIHLRTDDH